MKTNKTFRAAGMLVLAAFFLLFSAPAPAAAFVQKPAEADKQAQKGAEYLGRKDWKRAAESYQKAVRADARHVEANYGLGVAYMNLRQTGDALAAFSNVIAAQPNPRVREALVSTGAIHFALGHFKEAADALELAVPLGDIGPAGHYFLGKAYLQLERDDKALDSLRRAASDPQFAQDADFSVGYLLLKQNKSREAVAPLEQAVRLNARHAPSQMLLGNAYLAADRTEEALAALRAAAALDPNQLYTQLGLGYAHLGLYHTEEAVASFTVALRLQPDSPEAFAGLGNAYTRLGRYREAEDAFSRALAAKPDSPEALLGQCVLHYSQGQYAKLVSSAQQAARVAPRSAAAQTMLGAALATTGDMQGGLRATREALRLEPDNYWPHHVLGFILVRDDKPKEALAEARTVVRARPGLPETQNLLAYVLNQLGQHQEALQAAQAALQHRHEPADEGWAHYNLATAQEKLGRAEEARASYAAAIRAYNQPGRTLDPDDLYLMGNAYLRLEQDAPAVKAFQQAINVRPNFAQARYNLGVAYFATGNRKGAQDEYNALRRLDPARAAKLQAVIAGRPGKK
jgi:tetratricopeptide (TPR) repeat protein